MTEFTKFNAQQAYDALVEAVATEGPEYVYQKVDNPDSPGQYCSYVRDDCPSCLVGRAAHILGVDLETLKDWDESHNSSISIRGHERFTESAVQVLSAAQRAQDKGFTWGQALSDAKNVLGIVGALDG